MKELELKITELLLYGSVSWLNCARVMSNGRKATQSNAVLFVFKSYIVLICVETGNRTRKRTKV